jgi:protein-export membrane protein SecD
MKSLIFKLFLTAIGGCFIMLFALPWNYFNLEVPFSGPEYKLGLDLSGGIELDYKVDLTEVVLEEDYNLQRKKAVLEGLKSIIDKRIETLNINDSIITTASYGGEEHIIVQIPLKGNDALQSSDNIERAKAAIGKVVKIEFKELRDDITAEDIAERKILAQGIYQELSAKVDEFSIESERVTTNTDNVIIWTSVSLDTEFSHATASGALNIQLQENGYAAELLSVNDNNGTEWYLVYKKTENSYQYIFIKSEPSIWIPAEDSQGRVLSDKYFVNSSVQHNEAFQTMVELTFNNDGAEIFWELTKRLTWNPMAIFVGGELLTAPNINEPILSGRAVITGNYTPDSARILSDDINIGVVPAPIYLTSERTIDARLGQDSLEKIVFAWILWFVSILLFLIYIYRFSGLIAAVALFIYIAITLAILKQFGIVLTLASIAGLVLSIGIAIDANILIFERVKDEIRKWENQREAVRIWFNKSFSAIWDANITGLIVAGILFIFGINMIKWFGFILALWILVSLFTVFFISRLFIRLLARSEVSDKKFIGR